MTITPARLLVLCVVVFLLFYGAHENGSHEQPATTTEYRMSDGSIVVSVQSPSFTIDPLYGLDALATPPTANRRERSPAHVPTVTLIDDYVGPRPAMPIETTLLGEVARSAVDGHVSNLRMLAVSGLLQPPAPPTAVAALPPPQPLPPTSRPQTPPAPPSIEAELDRADKLMASQPRRAMDLLVTLLTRATEANAETRAEIHYAKAKAHRALSEPSSALTEYRAAIELDPKARYLNGLAWALVTIKPTKMRNPTEAVELASRAVSSTDRRTANYLDTLAKALFASGNPEKALNVQQEAVELEPDNRSFARRLKYYADVVAAD